MTDMLDEYAYFCEWIVSNFNIQNSSIMYVSAALCKIWRLFMGSSPQALEKKHYYEYNFPVPGMHSNDISGIGSGTSMKLFSDSWPNYDQVCNLAYIDIRKHPYYHKEHRKNVLGCWLLLVILLSQNTVQRLNDLFISSYDNGKVPADNDHLGWTKLTSDVGLRCLWNTKIEWRQLMKPCW